LSKRSARDMPADPAAGENVGPELAPATWPGVVDAGVRGRRLAGGEAKRAGFSLFTDAPGGDDVGLEAERYALL
jgi:hypothetical protein